MLATTRDGARWMSHTEGMNVMPLAQGTIAHPGATRHTALPLTEVSR
jgi:hypothetical protein